MAQTSVVPNPGITDGSAGFISRVEELAYELRVEEVMTKNVKTVATTSQMMDALRLFRENHISGAPVLSPSNQLSGVISIEDLIRVLRDSGRRELQVSVADYMTADVITINDFEPIVEALKMFAQTNLGRIVVVNKAGSLVGMLTKGDITQGLLNALQQDYRIEEVRRYRASHLFQDIESERTSLILRYQVVHGDFVHGGTASSNVKKALIRLGANPQVARRCGIAIYEAEMNLIIHTLNGGEVRVEIEPHQIIMQTIDNGPGIEDIDLVMQPGYSTATDEIRELGFGAGMGLVNIGRCVDEMKLESELGKGSQLTMKINLKLEDVFRDGKRAANGEG